MKPVVIAGLALVAVLFLVMPALACDIPDEPLTQGYWKNHPGEWASEEKFSNFFKSGDSYLGVLKTPTRGNAYYILAHQHIAAYLNGAAWTEIGSIREVWWEAKSLFCTYGPDEIARMKGNDPVRRQFVSLAETLDAFNNGHYS
ncbi:MAG TPA: hypothetical protein ENN85_08865 [Methanoculleus sp.]|nr:hypothetical protein [Methanoculleus sp.]